MDPVTIVLTALLTQGTSEGVRVLVGAVREKLAAKQGGVELLDRYLRDGSVEPELRRMLQEVGAGTDQALIRLAEAALAQPRIRQTATGAVITQVAGDVGGSVIINAGPQASAQRDLSEQAQRMLMVAMKYDEQLHRIRYDQGDFVRIGRRDFKGPRARRALDELVDRGFVRWDREAKYIVTPAGADAAAELMELRGPAWADDRDSEMEADD